MADPLSPAVTQTGEPTSNQPMTQQDFDLQMQQMMQQQAGLEAEQSETAVEGPQLDGFEEQVVEQGLDPYASTKEERAASQSAWGKITEAERSLLGFSPRAAVATGLNDFMFETGRSVFDVLNTVGITDVDTTSAQDPNKRKEVLGSLEADGMVEKGGAGIVQFVAGFAAFNKALKAVGLAGNGIRWLSAGALTDAFGQDPFAEGMTDLLKQSEIPLLSDNFVTNYFAAEGNEDDSMWEARFKNAAEGSLVGYVVGKPIEVVLDKAWGVFRNMKGAYKAAAQGNDAKADELFEAAINDADEVAQATGQPFFDADKMEWDSGSFYVRQETPLPESNIKYNVPLDPKFQPQPASQLAGVLEQVQIDPAKAGPFRSLAEAAQALKDDTASRLRAAEAVGNDGVPITPGGQKSPMQPDIERQNVSLNMEQAPGKLVAGARAPLAPLTAPRYSAFKPRVVEPNKAPDAAVAQAADGAPTGATGKVEPVVRTVSPEAAQAFAKALKEGGENAIDSFEKTFNAGRWNTSKDVQEVIGQAADTLRLNGVKMDHKTTQAAVVELAETYLANPRVLLARLMQVSKNADDLPSVIVATKMMTASLGRRVLELNDQILKAAEAGAPTAHLELAYARDLSMLQGMLPEFTLVRHRAASGTWAGNIITEDTKTAESVLQTVKAFGGDSKVGRLLLSRLPRNKATEGILRVLRHKTWDALVQWRTGALLYGPRTHIVNITSNAAWAVGKPGMRALGAIMTGDGKTAMESLRTIYFLRSYLDDAVKMSKRAFVEDRGLLDPNHGTMELTQKAFQRLVDTGNPNALTASMRAIDGGTTLPMRALTSMDEFFKQASYRAFTRAEAVGHANAALKSGSLKEADYDAFVEKYVKESFAADGSATNVRGLQYAREATFTQDPTSQFAQVLQRAANELPALKMIFPFVRTPANLISEGMQMFPGTAPLSRKFWQNINGGDPAARADTIGKLAFGSMVGLGVWMYVNDGLITGAAPQDPKLRQVFLDSGRLPYSIYNADTKRWVQFNRLDPFALPIGMFADALLAQSSDDMTAQQAFQATAVGLADNLRDKTYFQGITDFMDLIGAGVGSAEMRLDKSVSTAGKFATSFIPNFMPQLNPDDTLRDARSVMDQALNKMWLGGGIAPKRDVTGQPVYKSTGWFPLVGEVPNWLTPFANALPADSPVKEELFKAQLKFQHPPRKEGNVSLEAYKNDKGQTAYDRYLELTGEIVKPSTGKNLLQTLEAVVPQLHKRYGDITPQADALGQFASPVEEEIKAIFGEYRAAAKSRLMKEFPELAIALKRDAVRASKSQRGEAARSPLDALPQ